MSGYDNHPGSRGFTSGNGYFKKHPLPYSVMLKIRVIVFRLKDKIGNGKEVTDLKEG